jgi:hypothetical protein
MAGESEDSFPKQESGKDEGVFTLPNKEEMLARLMKVNSNSHFAEKLYPRLTRSAGREKVPMGVVMMLTLAIHDYMEGLPPMMGALVEKQVPEFIDALIPDPKAAEEAKKLWEQTKG